MVRVAKEDPVEAEVVEGEVALVEVVVATMIAVVSTTAMVLGMMELLVVMEEMGLMVQRDKMEYVVLMVLLLMMEAFSGWCALPMEMSCTMELPVMMLR